MRINPNLTFNGQCEAAFKFYEQCLGGTTTFMMTYGDSPLAAQTPPDHHGRIMHATFTLGGTPGGQILQGADAFPEQYREPQSFSISIHLADADRAERIFNSLADGGEVTVPLQLTFWARSFGMVTDRFGIPWMINCSDNGL